jgi:glucose/mannose-6-phosphate isomerase
MLDNIEKIKQEDKKGVLTATEMIADQCTQAWTETKDIVFPEDYKDFHQVVVSGMGGSHLGAQLINAVYQQELKIPLIVQNQYKNPGYINEHTLVLATSFSGTTEEVLTFVKEAESRGAKIVCISSGGDLAKMAVDNGYPHYNFESTYNPSRIPRYGSGYLFIAQLVFLSKIGAINFTQTDFDTIIKILSSQKAKYTLVVPTAQNPAKKLAQSLKEKVAILVASEHLTGSAYIFKNQINESAKNYSDIHEIPEMDHHLLEGLAHPKSNKDDFAFVFFESDLYFDRNQRRHKITAEIIDKQGINVHSFKPEASTKLTQAFETLAFTSYVALYLSILNGVDPGPNPWVDYLKDQLKK